MNKPKQMFIILLFLSAFISLFLPNEGLAHSELVQSTPGQGETVSDPVSSIELNFGARVEEMLDITLTDKNGKTYPLEDPIVKGKTVIVMPKAPLETGQYKLYWHLIGIDTHKVHGYLTFGIGETAPSPSDITASNETTGDAPATSSSASAGEKHEQLSPFMITMIVILGLLILFGCIVIFKKKRE